MDLHKPKPWHGFREFLKEYAIIVVGVLTALGAEAVVQRFHEARLTDEAETAVRSEINVDITMLAEQFRPERQACVTRRLDEITAQLDKAEAGQGFEPPVVIGGPDLQNIYTQRWTIATASGRTSLLSSEQQRAFARVYLPLERIQESKREEFRAWLVLRALRGVRHLSPEMIHDQRLAVSAARDWNTIIGNQFRVAKGYAQQIGVKGDARLGTPNGAPASPGTPSVCQPMNGAAP